MNLNFDTANAIVEAAHAAWNNRNIEGVLDHYVDDLVYSCNAGGPNDGPLTVSGKSGLRGLLTPVLPVIESMTSIELFKFSNNIARLQLSAYVRHKRTGLELSGTYRQIMEFRGYKICKLEEIHDAALLSTFWRLVASETARPVTWLAE